MGFVKWLGRMILWIPPLTPIGLWRSMHHHGKKGQRRAVETIRNDMRKDTP